REHALRARAELIDPALEERQREDEGRAAAELALDGDAPAVGLDDALGDGQPKPEADVARLLRAPEAIEDVRERVRRDAGPLVLHREADAAPRARGRDHDAPAGRGELQRVADEVREHLHDPLAIAVELLVLDRTGF